MPCEAAGRIILGDGDVGICSTIDRKTGRGILCMYQRNESIPVGTLLPKDEPVIPQFVIEFKEIGAIDCLYRMLSHAKALMIGDIERRKADVKSED